MSKHNYTALTTFRGWDKQEKCWVYGPLFEADTGFHIITEPVENHRGDLNLDYSYLHPDSIGVYTGDNDKDGKAIFASIPVSKYGYDIVKRYRLDNGEYYDAVEVFSDRVNNLVMDANGAGIWLTLELIGSAWEKHLKATA